MARATNEANEAQTAVYRLTQSSGTNTMTLLSNVRSHIYALQCLNTLAANIYGAGTVIVDGSMLTACIATLDTAEQRLQAGNVLTGSMTELRDEVDAIVALSSGRAAFLYPFAIRHTASISFFASAAVFISPGLTRTAPMFSVPKNRCTPGAQCSPPRTAMPCSSSAEATTCEAIPATLKLSSDASARVYTRTPAISRSASRIMPHRAAVVSRASC